MKPDRFRNDPAWQRHLELCEEELSRRALLRLVAGGAIGLTLVSSSTRRGSNAVAQEATVEPEADPEADPEATASQSPTPGVVGSPVGSAGNLTIYSGRNENLVGALIERFEAATGIDAEVRYGETAALAATIVEEGANSPASLFLSQDAGALGALAEAGRLRQLPDELLNRVDARFRSPDGLWVGTSGRARVLAYNTDALTDADLPASVLDLVDPKWKGQIGWAPPNASFQAFVTALRLLEGEDGARAWLEGMLANEPATFDGNGPIVAALGTGELQIGLVNHYYLYETKAEQGDDFPVANHFFAAGDPGSLVNVAGVGVLADAPDADAAVRFAEFLLEPAAQTYFAEETFEYPLIAGVATAPGLKPLSDVQGPDIDLGDLADLQGTLELLSEVGAL
jgi:iron(III) transport system substrate-binding protein